LCAGGQDATKIDLIAIDDSGYCRLRQPSADRLRQRGRGRTLSKGTLRTIRE
jgi:hypothetical protein